MSHFSIQIDHQNSQDVIRVHGEIDLHTCPDLHKTLSEQLAQGASQFVLDLNQVHYLDSTGLGVIAHAARQLGEKQGQVHIITTQPQVLKIFDLSGLTKKNIIIHANLADVPA